MSDYDVFGWMVVGVLSCYLVAITIDVIRQLCKEGVDNANGRPGNGKAYHTIHDSPARHGKETTP